ncbi:MAG: MBL fold metallo-hydrolase [Deferribacterales bacterium]
MTQHTVNTPYMVGPVHFYTFELDDGSFIMFDTGPFTLEASKYIMDNLDLNRLSHLFITHCHLDHYGLLHFIRQNSKAKIFISKNDYLKYKLFKERKELLYKILIEEGFPEESITKINQVFDYFKNILPDPEADILEDNTDLLTKLNLRYIPCPGHSQSDIVYLYQDYAITGDVILMDIFQTPLFDLDLNKLNCRYNNYKAYINTIDKLINIQDKIILPGHNKKIDSIKVRIEWYLDKLLSRICRIHQKIMKETLYTTLISSNIDVNNDPLTLYLKLSELFFMRDFILEPNPLVNTIQKHNLDINIQKYLEFIYEGKK